MAQSKAQQQRETNHIAQQRKKQRLALCLRRPGRACKEQKRYRQSPGQRGAPEGNKPGRELRVIGGAGGQTRHRQRDGKHHNGQEAQPHAQGLLALAQAPSIHRAVSTSKAAMTRLNHCKRKPVGRPSRSGPLSHWRAIEPSTA